MTTINTHGNGPVATVQGHTRITYNGRTRTARTVDGVEITEGLRVFTNNLDRGTVTLAGSNWEWHGPEGVYHFWFYVNIDTDYKGNAVTQRYSQSDDRVTTRYRGEVA